MDRPTRSDRILDEWASVANEARPPAPRRGVVISNRLPLATLVGAALVAIAVFAAGSLLGRGTSADLVGSSPSASATVVAQLPASPSAFPSPVVASIPPSAPPSASATTHPTAPPTSPPSTAPRVGPCDPGQLAARITMWEGAAGSRIATVELTNGGDGACLVDDISRPQLLDRTGRVLIDGASPASPTPISIDPAGVLTTLVSAANVCDPTATPPVTIDFVQADGRRIVATSDHPRDAVVPPCLGAGQPATIEMHAWSR